MSTKVGFIGAGDISLLHAEGVHECPSAELVGLWNRTAKRGEEKAALFGCRTYATAEELVSDPEIDVVYVLTNMETHHKYSLMAIEAGKHVLVEKPTATTVQEIQEMEDAANRAGVLIAPVHNYLYEPSVMRAKDLIDSGKLGDLVSLYVMYNIHHPEEVAARYPGVIRQIMTHHAYILLYLVGAPACVPAMKATINDGSVPQENLAMATLQMRSGALTHFCASFASDDHAGDPWTVMIKVIGTRGATRYSYRDWVENTPAIVHSQTYSAYPYTIRSVGRYFIEECIGNGRPPLSSMQDAVTSLRLIEAIEASVEEGRHVGVMRNE